jgi:hypothetical protein
MTVREATISPTEIVESGGSLRRKPRFRCWPNSGPNRVAPRTPCWRNRRNPHRKAVCVVAVGAACHAGGRGFESRRSRSRFGLLGLNPCTRVRPPGQPLGPDLAQTPSVAWQASPVAPVLDLSGWLSRAESADTQRDYASRLHKASGVQRRHTRAVRSYDRRFSDHRGPRLWDSGSRSCPISLR